MPRGHPGVLMQVACQAISGGIVGVTMSKIIIIGNSESDPEIIGGRRGTQTSPWVSRFSWGWCRLSQGLPEVKGWAGLMD